MVKIPYGRYGLDFSFVSDEDWVECWKYKWRDNGNGYIATYIIINGQQTILHQHKLIGQRMGLNPNRDIDHRDRNRLNNQRSNLRNLTESNNKFNSKLYTNNKSGVTGISWDKRYNKYRATITVNQKLIHLGYFTNFEDAVAARIKAEEQYYPGIKI